MSDNKYCLYWNPTWFKKFNNKKSRHYKTKVDGNMMYILYRKTLFNLLFRKAYGANREVDRICMVDLPECQLVYWLESWGFIFD